MKKSLKRLAPVIFLLVSFIAMGSFFVGPVEAIRLTGIVVASICWLVVFLFLIVWSTLPD